MYCHTIISLVIFYLLILPRMYRSKSIIWFNIYYSLIYIAINNNKFSVIYINYNIQGNNFNGENFAHLIF